MSGGHQVSGETNWCEDVSGCTVADMNDSERERRVKERQVTEHSLCLNECENERMKKRIINQNLKTENQLTENLLLLHKSG